MSGKRPGKRWIGPAIGCAGAAVALGAVFLWARNMLAKDQGPERAVPQVITLIRPPEAPPPPPPPPPEEEKVEDPIPQDEPAPADDAPQEQLGLDAAGAAGSDSFGLAARRGGADLIGSGSALFGWYTALIKDAILDQLEADERVRRGSYSIVVRVWLANDGRVERVALAQSSGRAELDQSISQSLSGLSRLPQSPPVEMPQPVTLRIVSRG